MSRSIMYIEICSLNCGSYYLLRVLYFSNYVTRFHFLTDLEKNFHFEAWTLECHLYDCFFLFLSFIFHSKSIQGFLLFLLDSNFYLPPGLYCIIPIASKYYKPYQREKLVFLVSIFFFSFSDFLCSSNVIRTFFKIQEISVWEGYNNITDETDPIVIAGWAGWVIHLKIT